MVNEEASHTGIRRFFANWGPVVGFVGGLIGIAGGGMSVWDRFNPPAVEILDLTPVYISEPKTVMGAKGAIRGTGVVLHVRAGSRDASVTEIRLEGRRCITFDEFFGIVEADGKSMEQMESEFYDQRPFQQVAFAGLPKDRNGPLTLKAWEENNFFFTLSEPKLGGGGGIVIESDYIGTRQREYPKIRDYGFSVLDIFTVIPNERTSWTVGHLRNEILDGVLTFKVIAGGASVTIPSTAVRAPKRLSTDEWRRGDLSAIRTSDTPDIVIAPKENASINCYIQSKRP